jgi:transposase
MDKRLAQTLTVEEAGEIRLKAEKAADDARELFGAVVARELKRGAQPTEIARRGKVTYETIRRIARKYRLKPLREPRQAAG